MENNVSLIPTEKTKIAILSDSLLVMEKLKDELTSVPFSEWKVAFNNVQKEICELHRVETVCPLTILDDFYDIIHNGLFYKDGKPSMEKQFSRYSPLFNYCLTSAYIESLPSVFKELTGEELDESKTFNELERIFSEHKSFLVADPYVMKAMISTLQIIGVDPSGIVAIMQGEGKLLARRELTVLTMIQEAQEACIEVMVQ